MGRHKVLGPAFCFSLLSFTSLSFSSNRFPLPSSLLPSSRIFQASSCNFGRPLRRPLPPPLGSASERASTLSRYGVRPPRRRCNLRENGKGQAGRASSLCLACRRTRASSLPPLPPSPAQGPPPSAHRLLGKWQDGSPACLRLIAAARQYNRASHDQQPGPPPPPPPGSPARPNSGFAVRTYRLSLKSQIAFSLPHHHHHLPFHLPFFGSPLLHLGFPAPDRGAGEEVVGSWNEEGACVCLFRFFRIFVRFLLFLPFQKGKNSTSRGRKKIMLSESKEG